MKIVGFILYKIWYGDTLVYIGRTKQPLQNRIRGHMFNKPMHRHIAIENVTKIQYATFKTEADMNIYEVYLIVKLHPPLNVDDKTRDYPTVRLPAVEWKEFTTPLWDGWREELSRRQSDKEKLYSQYRDFPQQISVLRSKRRMEEITEDEFYAKYDRLKTEYVTAEKKLFGQ